MRRVCGEHARTVKLQPMAMTRPRAEPEWRKVVIFECLGESCRARVRYKKIVLGGLHKIVISGMRVRDRSV